MSAAEAISPSPRQLRPAKPLIGLTSIQKAYRSTLLGKLADGEFAFEDVPTCLCGSTGGVVLAHQDRFGIPIGVLGCADCGLLRTSPRLAADDLPAFYESDYHGLHFGTKRPSPATSLFRKGQGAAIWAFVSRDLRSRKPPDRLRVVEIGAGTGSVLRELAAAAAADGVEVESVGCEYSSAYASAAGELGTEIRAGGIETLVDTGLTPDLVIMSHVLEHFPNPLRDLQLVMSLAHPQTLIYVEVPGLLTIHTKPHYDYQFGPYLTLAHTYHFTLATLVDAMQRAGFQLVRGDEEVRSLFRLASRTGPVSSADVAQAFTPASARLSQLQSYLRWLDRSPRMVLRRAVLRAQRYRSFVAARAVRRILGERGYSAIRRLLRGKGDRQAN